jgi:hypothetical protein
MVVCRKVYILLKFFFFRKGENTDKYYILFKVVSLPKSFIMNLVNNVDSVSPLDQYHRDSIFNLFVTCIIYTLISFFFSDEPVHKRGGEDKLGELCSPKWTNLVGVNV